MSVIFLAQHREKHRQVAARNLEMVLDTELPMDMYMEEGSEIAVLTNADWTSLDRLFSAFGLTVSRDIKADRLIDLWYYLTGELGYDLRLRLRNESLYHDIKSRLHPQVQDYLNAVFTGDLKKAAEMARNLAIIENCPVVDSPFKVGLTERGTDR